MSLQPGVRSGAATIAWVLAAVLVSCSGSAPAPSESRRPSTGGAVPTRTPTPPPTTERPAVVLGSERWRLTRPARDSQIEGYATTSGGPPGERIELRVSTSASSYRVHTYRLGWYAGGTGHRVWSSPRLPGHRQPAAVFADSHRRTIVAPWRRSVVVDTDGWAPGLYVFKLRTDDDWQAHVPYVVTSRSTQGRVALVAPVTTWQAYNDWGGYSLYDAPPGDRRSWTVSFDRPYPAPGSGEMIFGVVPVVLAAERRGVPLAYLTNLDLDARPDALAGARGYVSMGHDEYWTPTMRRRVTAARDAGTNLAFLGANTMYWRVRLARAGRLLTGFRSDAGLDPVQGSRRTTGLFRDPPKGQPENSLTGMRYECFPVDQPYRVVSPRWWGFEGTGVRAGDEFGHLVGVEADRVYPVPGTPRPLQVLAHVGYDCRGVSTSAQSVYYTVPSGAGVFNAGTLRWTCALRGRCGPVDLTPETRAFVRTVTANILRQFAKGPVGARHPARDNVGRFDLPDTNLVPAS